MTAAELLTPEQAAEYLALSTSTLANWRWKTVGPPFVKIGKRAVRYDRSQLEAWAQSQKAESA